MTDSTETTFLYFAYGSNMHSPRLSERTPSASRVDTGYLPGHTLTFDKVSTDDGSGKCDIPPSSDPNDRVYGVLYTIKSAERGRLDRAEGVGKGYRDAQVRVTTDKGECTALAYIATRTDPDLRPYDWYKALVVEGAERNGLPSAYIDRIRSVRSVPDPDDARRLANGL